MFYFRVAALFLLFSIVLGAYAPYYDLADAEQYFADFIKEYDRKYENIKEFRKRFDIFKRNLQRLNELNDKYKHKNGAHVITQFADQEGYRSCVDLSKVSNTTKKIQVSKESILNAPDSIDYRNQNLVTEVKDQGSCGSCYIFAAIGNIEGMHAKASGELVSLSEQQPLDCASNGCNPGAPLNVMNAVKGCMTEADYPYEAVQGTCRADSSKYKVQVTGGHEISTPDVETMKGALADNGAPLATLLFSSQFFENYRGTDVISPADCPGDGTSLNHAVLLVGYNTDTSGGKRPHWIIKNSWGSTIHGDQGYFYLDFENKCNFGRQGTSTASVA